VHHYPETASTLAWGAGLGAVALLSTVAVQWVKACFSGLLTKGDFVTSIRHSYFAEVPVSL
jgi:hypothetical protein